jgi:hypothetical protein
MAKAKEKSVYQRKSPMYKHCMYNEKFKLKFWDTGLRLIIGIYSLNTVHSAFNGLTK